MAVPQQLRHVISACVEMTAVSMQPVFGRARYQIHSVCVCVCVCVVDDVSLLVSNLFFVVVDGRGTRASTS